MQNNHEFQEFRKYLRLISVCLILLVIIFVFANAGAFSGAVATLFRVLSSALYGFLYAYLLNPFVRFVDRRLAPALQKRGIMEIKARKISRVFGILFAFMVAALLIYLLVEMIVPQLGQSIVGIANKMPEYYKSIENWMQRLLEDNPQIKYYVNMALENSYDHLEDFVKNDLVGKVQDVLVSVTTSAYAVVREVINMIIGMVVAVYVLWSKDQFLCQSKKMVVAAFDSERADRIMESGRQIDRIFNGFIIGKLIDSLIIGILCYIGVSILKMPYPVLLATIVGITNIIPYFGPIIGTIPCAVLVLLDSPLKCLYFVIFVLALQQVDGNIIGPKILGGNVGISGFWILVSITVGGGLFGFLGMLLGVPVFAVIYMLVSDFTNRSLVKKGRTTRTWDYFHMNRVQDLPPEESESAAKDAAPEEKKS